MNTCPIELPPQTAGELALETDIEATSELLGIFEGDELFADQAKATMLKLATLVKNRTPAQILRIEFERRGA